ncbi:MAG: RluA family pseudouridine synthase [Clostridium sp.]|nr:RluA family pseudouridine synthase [Clostridium sp.]MCM1443838.1 RluA family pseudouridine synthase [Candidatus Amulumruptor caecigallinarius]
MEDGKVMINIIYEDNHLLVVLKPVNTLVQADNTKDIDLLTMLKQYLKEKYNKKGNVYLGLVHRLDRPVGGVMVFAKTSKAASRLSDQIRLNQFKKKYYAIVEGKIKESGFFEDKLLKDSKSNIVKVDSNGKLSKLSYSLVKYNKSLNLSLVDILLITGRPHQIRVQFSSRGFPLYGDQKYNINSKVGNQIALFAYHLEFYHPITKELLIFNQNLPNLKPWLYFKV